MSSGDNNRKEENTDVVELECTLEQLCLDKQREVREVQDRYLARRCKLLHRASPKPSKSRTCKLQVGDKVILLNRVHLQSHSHPTSGAEGTICRATPKFFWIQIWNKKTNKFEEHRGAASNLQKLPS